MKCRICNNEVGNKNYIAYEMLCGSREEFKYFKCSSCDCLQIQKYPNDIKKYYGSTYYSYKEISPERSRFKLLKNKRDLYAITNKGFIGRVLYYIKPNDLLHNCGIGLTNKNCKVLDVGCGSGYFLESLRRLSYSDLTGIDPFIDKDVLDKNGICIYKNHIDNISGEYDAIFFHHSLEHMPNQHDQMKNIARLLSKNGFCIIRIPICSSFAWEKYGVNWVQLDAPRHFYLHSLKSIKILAMTAGLEVVNVVYDSTGFQYSGSENYKKNKMIISEEENYVTAKIKNIYYDVNARILNMQKKGDQAVFVLRKKL